jgi:hypothetical protein
MIFPFIKARLFFAIEFMLFLLFSAFAFQSTSEYKTIDIILAAVQLALRAIFWYLAYRKKWEEWIPASAICLYCFLMTSFRHLVPMFNGSLPALTMFILDAVLAFSAYIFLKCHSSDKDISDFARK